MPIYSKYTGVGGPGYTFVGVAPITVTELLGTVTTSMTQSGVATDGWLSSIDWNVFNSKQNALTFGDLTEATSNVLTITGGTGAVIGAGTTIQVSQSGVATDGYLSSADWNTFNNKQPAGNYANDTLSNLSAPTAVNVALLGTLGTNSAPAYSFTGDTDTGMFSSAANVLNFSTSGTEAMRITDVGNILIGTTTNGSSGLTIKPSFNISWPQANNESIPTIFRQQSSAGTVIANGYQYSTTVGGFASSTSISWAKSAIVLGPQLGAGAITFYTDTAATVAAGTDVTPTERMRINSSGNVLIGTDTSAGSNVRLQLSSNTYTTEIIDSYNNASAFGAALLFRSARGTAAAPTASQQNDEIGWVGAYGYGASGFSAGSRAALSMYAAENWTATAQGTYITLRTTTAGSASTAERVRVTDVGSVGIGGTPENINTRLFIFGPQTTNTFIRNRTTDAIPVFRGDRQNGTVALPTAIASGDELMQVSAGGYDGTAFSTGRAGISMFSSEAWTNVAQGAELRFSTTPTGSTTIAERMRITDGGNVGINTTSPSSALSVKGEVRLFGATSGYVGMISPAAPVSYTVTMPSAQGVANTVLANDGSGNLTWQYAGLGAGSLGTNNLILGRSKPGSITTAQDLIVAGPGAINSLTSGSRHVAIGTDALAAATTTSDCLGIGFNALKLSAGSIGRNTAVGAYALASAVGAGYCTAVGADAGRNALGSANTFIGENAGLAAVGSTGASNTSVGSSALRSLSSGANNTAVGESALRAVATGASNVGIGFQTGDAITTGTDNVFVGKGAGGAATVITSAIGIGSDAMAAALLTTNGSGAVSIGHQSLNAATTMPLNIGSGEYSAIAIGYQSAYLIPTATSSISIGTRANRGNTGNINYSVVVGHLAGNTGGANVIMGSEAGNSMTGSGNSLFGHTAGFSITSGTNNIGLGYAVLRNQDANQKGTSLTTGTYNISIGYYANTSAVNSNGAISLGTYAVAASNEFAVGGVGTNGAFQINTMLLGRGGAEQTAANAVKIMTMRPDATANRDLSAGTLTLAGSQSTGSSLGGDVIIATAPAGTPGGTTANAHVERIRAKAATEVVVNDTGVDFDFRVEGDTDANLLMVDAGADKVGIGTATPQEKLDVGTGNARISNGDLILNTAGNGINIKEGTNARLGVTGAFPATNPNTVTVSTTEVTANSRIFLTVQSNAGGHQPDVYISTVTANTSFVITAHDNNFAGTVAWMIIEPA